MYQALYHGLSRDMGRGLVFSDAGRPNAGRSTLEDLASTASATHLQPVTGTSAATLAAATSSAYGIASDAALELDFQFGDVDSRISVARSGSAWTVDSTGALVSVPANTVRIWHDPQTLQRLGALVEETRQNLLLNMNPALSTQSVTVTNVAHTLSFYGAGTVTLSGTSTAGPLVGTGANQRVTLTFTPTAGSLTLTVSGSVTWANLEVGASATSPIITAGSPVTRNTDTPQISSLGAWFNSSEGTMMVDFTPQTISGLQTFVYFDDGSANERMGIRSSAGANAMLCVDGNVVQSQSTIGTVTAGNAFKCAFGWKANDFAGCQNGGTVMTDASGTIPTVSALKIGFRLTNTEPANAIIRKVKVYSTRKTNPEIQAMTV